MDTEREAQDIHLSFQEWFHVYSCLFMAKHRGINQKTLESHEQFLPPALGNSQPEVAGCQSTGRLLCTSDSDGYLKHGHSRPTKGTPIGN